MNPQLLLYLAEAADLPRALVDRAVSAALASGPTLSAMSAAVRRHIPWVVVEQALLAKVRDRNRRRR